jgi:hypothetical protein
MLLIPSSCDQNTGMTHVKESKALALEKTNVSKVYANRKYNKQMMDMFQSSPQKRPLHKSKIYNWSSCLLK